VLCSSTHPVSAGPWFIGELIDGHSGACFAFGVVIDGHFLEGSLTYVVGVGQVRRLVFSQDHYEMILRDTVFIHAHDRS
jgi:hypothetical protein